MRGATLAGSGLLLCPLVLGAVLSSSATGQYLETTIMLPDSFASTAFLASVAYNPESDRIYVGDEDGWVLVLDARTRAKLAKIRVGIRQVVHSLLSIPGTSKLYAAVDSRIEVIDCDSIAKEIPVDVGCYRFAGFDSAGGKAYYMGYDTGYVAAAIDVTRDSVVANIPLGQERISVACFNTRNRKLYLTDKDRVSRRLTVVDTRVDSVLRAFTMGKNPTALGYNPTENKVYCGYSSGVYILDGEADTLIGTGHAMSGGPGVIGFSPDANKVYCGIGGGESPDVYILDGSTDSTIAIATAGPGPRAMLYNSRDSNLYVACGEGDELSVIDGQSDSVLAHLAAGRMASFLTIDTGRNLVYCAAKYGRDVSVTQGTSVTPVEVVYTGFWPIDMCYDSIGDKVYVTNWDRLGCAAVIDCSTNEVVANIRVGQWPQSVCYSSSGNKIYCANSGWDSVGSISVIDAGADTVLRTVVTAAGPFDVCYNPERNRVYCGHPVEHMTVIDAGPDTVVKLVATPYPGSNLAFVPTSNKLYYNLGIPWGYRLGVIDCATESLTAVLPWSGGERPKAYVGHPVKGKVYFASSETLKAIDAMGDTLVPPSLRMTTQGYVLCWNSTNDKLYWAGGDSVTIVDCSADTTITMVSAGSRGLLYDPVGNRVYCSGQGTVTVIDGAANKVLARIAAGPGAWNMAHSSPQERLYVANWDGSNISVIQTAVPGVVGRPDAATLAAQAGPTVVRGWLVLAEVLCRESVGASLLDATGRKVLDLHPGANDVRALAPGVYFVREQPQASGSKPPAVRKIVVTH